MKALSLRQPWAELIISGNKTIETRTWNTSYRGPFLIHASLQAHPDHMKQFGYHPDELTRGAIVGIAELMSIIEYPSLAVFKQDEEKHHVNINTWKKPLYGYVLSHVRRITPIPYKGRLHFFPVSKDVLNQLRTK